jgi:hypothetical protein
MFLSGSLTNSVFSRPDALVDPDEVAKAFDELRRSGKARYFGVSAHPHEASQESVPARSLPRLLGRHGRDTVFRSGKDTQAA